MVEINLDLKRIIQENPIALATINDNLPNIIVVAFAKVVSDDQILITDNYMNKTKDDLNSNNNVCLAVWNKDWEGYKLIGKAQYYKEGKWLDYVRNMPENKGLPANGAILINLNKIIKLK
jgi:predicted pyridoxine 5'-phosphate oxidase superfamily flavin-nucleotide-binding protein